MTENTVKCQEPEMDGTTKCDIDGHGVYDSDSGPCPLCNQDETKEKGDLNRSHWFH